MPVHGKKMFKNSLNLTSFSPLLGPKGTSHFFANVNSLHQWIIPAEIVLVVLEKKSFKEKVYGRRTDGRTVADTYRSLVHSAQMS